MHNYSGKGWCTDAIHINIHCVYKKLNVRSYTIPGVAWVGIIMSSGGYNIVRVLFAVVYKYSSGT